MNINTFGAIIFRMQHFKFFFSLHGHVLFKGLKCVTLFLLNLLFFQVTHQRGIRNGLGQFSTLLVGIIVSSGVLSCAVAADKACELVCLGKGSIHDK